VINQQAQVIRKYHLCLLKTAFVNGRLVSGQKWPIILGRGGGQLALDTLTPALNLNLLRVSVLFDKASLVLWRCQRNQAGVAHKFKELSRFFQTKHKTVKYNLVVRTRVPFKEAGHDSQRRIERTDPLINP
jgi:hypothetical protein